MDQEFMYLAKIEKDTIELLTKRPENFEVKFVDSKIHQSLFSELYYFLNQDQKDITTLLDVARSIIDKVSILRERTIKTRKGISRQAQDFIREVRDARSPEDLIYVKIPESLGLESITSKKCVSTEKYVNNLQSVFDEIHHFEENIFPSLPTVTKTSFPKATPNKSFVTPVDPEVQVSALVVLSASSIS